MKKALLWLSAVIVALAAAFNVLGGLGTSCVALFAERFGESMAPLVPYKWLYLVFVITGTATGVWEGVAVAGLVRRTRGAFPRCAASLAAGALVAGAHAAASQVLRGAAAPADMRAYVTLAALAIVLAAGGTGAFRGPDGGSEEASEGAGSAGAGGAALIAAGVLTIVTPLVMRSTHVLAGVDHAAAWGPVVPLAGTALVATGAVTALRAARRRYAVWD